MFARFMLGFLFIAMVGCLFFLTGCASTSKITTIDFDPVSGAKIKETVTETKESVVDQVIASTKDKSVYIFDKGWAAGIRATVVSTDNPTPILEIIAYHHNKGILTVHKDHKDKLGEFAKLVEACNSIDSLGISATGITSSSVKATDSSVPVEAYTIDIFDSRAIAALQ